VSAREPHGKPVVLVVSPMPMVPAGAGNRRRLLATVEFLEHAGFAVDFAYLAHEDQIYRRFDQHPPTDLAAMTARFRRLYFIEIAEPIRLRTGADAFGLDDWCPPELDAFVRRYFETTPEARAILVNYVWLSRALEAAPADRLKLIDTHDRFADRKAQYRRFRAEANFFHTDAAGEARGLGRADLVIAIQPAEKAIFEALTGREVALLLPRFDEVRPFAAPKRLANIGFIGHGNDANLHSIGRFLALWSKAWKPGLPKLVIAGEICRALPADLGPGAVSRGYVETIGDFYAEVDLVIAPMLLGTGLKMKVVEALAHGVSVIGTPIGFEGIETTVPEHGLKRLDAIVARIVELAGDEAGLARLGDGCARVFERYRALADATAEALAARLVAACPASETVSPPLVPPPEEADASVDGPIREVVSLGSPAGDLADASLIATEFRPFDPDDPSTASPFRRRWYLAADADVAPRPSPLAGRTVSLSPLLTARPASPEAARRSAVAAAALIDASPDWSSPVEAIGTGAGRVRLSFHGPAFLIHPATTLRVFLIDGDGRASELAEPACVRRIVAGNAPAGTRQSKRVGDAPPIGLTLSGVGSLAAARAAVIIARGLWGRVDLAPAAGTTGTRTR
jgi:glycosyltransferase involved in cell wall biosynthesis